MSTALAIDTSHGTHVALVRDGVVLARGSREDPRGHAEHTMPLVVAALAEAGLTTADLDAVVAGTGPAPFTGLRVGLVTALALARARQVPVHGVPSLEAWAAGELAVAERVRVVTDARRREVYTASYRRGDGPGGLEVVSAPEVIAPADLAGVIERERAEGVAVVGPGLFPEVLGSGGGVFDAGALVALGLARAAAGVATPLEPLYLRRPDIHGVPAPAA